MLFKKTADGGGEDGYGDPPIENNHPLRQSRNSSQGPNQQQPIGNHFQASPIKG